MEQKINGFLMGNGFAQMKSEMCIFITEDKGIILFIYVDDGIPIVCNHAKLRDFLQI